MKTPQVQVQNIGGDGQMTGMDRSLSSHSDQQDIDEDIDDSHNGSLDLMQQGIIILDKQIKYARL